MDSEQDLRQMPPSHVAAEKALLGALLVDSTCLVQVIPVIKPEHFYAQEHRDIYAVVLRLFEAKSAIDMVTIQAALEERCEGNPLHALEVVTELMEAVPSPANVEYYAQIVADRAYRRQLIDASNRLLTRSFNTGQPTAEIITVHQERIGRIVQEMHSRDEVTFRDVLTEAMEAIDERATTKSIGGISTGFIDFDRKVGGIPKGKFLILAARPSMGKTSLAMNIMCHLVFVQEKKCMFFSYETSRSDFAQNILCAETRVERHRVDTGEVTDAELERISRKATALQDARLVIETKNMDIDQLQAVARAEHSKESIDLIVMDYIQLAKGRSREEENSPVQRVGAISKGLKNLAQELGVPVVGISQLNRAVESRDNKRPRLSDLRDSGTLEQDADIVAFLYRHEYYAERGSMPGGDGKSATVSRANEADLIIGKNKCGPCITVTLTFLKQFLRFENYMEGRSDEP